MRKINSQRVLMWVLVYATIAILVVLVLSLPSNSQTLPDAPSTVCARQVNCDDPIVDSLTGEVHHYGDYLRDCFDPRVSRTMVLTNGPCEKEIEVVTHTPFFKFRRYWQPPLRTNREILTSKTFLLLHGVALASVVADVEVTHQGLAHHKCLEGNSTLPSRPSRGRLYRDDLGLLGGAVLTSFVFDKYFWRPLWLPLPAAITFVHVQGAASWFQDVCY